jgi:glycosyltransferase involved in cell wall biosynthesis
MRIAVVNNTVPFLRGGAEVLAEALVDQLRPAGHDAELFRLPFAWQPVERVADGMLAAALTRIENVDRVVAFKFPAYLVPHDDKVLWLVHQFRQVYDLWGTEHGYEQTPEAEAVREMVTRADAACFDDATRIFTNSSVTADRLFRFNGFGAEVLHPPLPDESIFRNAGNGGYIFAGGRINAFKRQLLAVQAMAFTKTDVQLVVAGPPDAPADAKALYAAREASGRPERITIVPQYVSEAHKAELVNFSLGCVYCPIDEDSYGYVTLEAAQAGKPLITTTDAGGITQLVIHQQSGLVCAPEPAELATAFDELHRSPLVADALGRGARQRMVDLEISWQHVIDRLLAP